MASMKERSVREIETEDVAFVVAASVRREVSSSAVVFRALVPVVVRRSDAVIRA